MDHKPIHYIRSIFAMLVFFVLLLLVFPVILVLAPLSAGRLISPMIERFGSAIGYTTLRIAGIRLNVQAHPESLSQPAVYIINHSSTLDMLIIIALGLPNVRFVVKHEFQYNPIFLLVGRLTGQIFIRRQRSDEAIEKLRKTERKIQRQRLSILMAPEGSRKHEGIIGPFKKGPFHLAMDLNYPIVPIYVEGVRELSEGGSLIAKPGTIEAHIHAPIDTSGWSRETMDQCIEEIRDMYVGWSRSAGFNSKYSRKDHN